MSLNDYSERNVLNSIAQYLAANLIDYGYLIYYHKADILQISTSPTGYYLQFSQNRAAILADSVVSAAVTASKGLVTILDGIPANPRFITRHISSTSLGSVDEVSIPALSIELGPMMPAGRYELGSRIKWRERHLVVDSYVRGVQEQALFKDKLANWLDKDTLIDVLDHESGTLGVLGTVRLDEIRVDSARYPDAAESMTHEVLANAITEYVA